MRKIGIVLVVCLLAVTGIMAAMAYSSASVENPASMRVVSTNEALVELWPNTGVGYKDITSYIEDGRLNFNFAIGKGDHNSGWKPKNRGFQPGSSYTWNELFFIQNQSADNVEYTIMNEGLKYINVTVVKAEGAGVTLPLIVNGVHQGKGSGMASGDTVAIKVSFDIPEDAAIEDLSGTLTVLTRAKESIGRHGLVAW